MQLVAYGAQDIYLTGNPQITFFKVVYRRHTNFAMECVQQTLNGSVAASSSVTATISRNGDLVYKLYVTSNNSSCTNGSAIVSEAEVEIGGQRIDRHYAEWMQIWNELSTPESKAVGLKAMQGDVGTVTTTGVGKINVPLLFWFCRNPGLALPLIALQYHEVKIKLTLGAAGTGAESAELWADYIYLDTDERRRFAQVSHEYLIEQVQRQSASNTATTKLNFNHPVKELIWTSVATNAYGTAQLKLNGHDRFAAQEEEYFQLRQPYDCHTAVPRQNLPSCAKNFQNSGSGVNLISTNITGAGANLNAAVVSANTVHIGVVDTLDTGNDTAFTSGQYIVGAAAGAGYISGAGGGAFILPSALGDLFKEGRYYDLTGYGTMWIGSMSSNSNTATTHRVYVNGNFIVASGGTASTSVPEATDVLVNLQPVITEGTVTSSTHFVITEVREVGGSYSITQARTSQMTKKINVYSFALKPEEHQPSGTCNFSRIDNAQLVTDSSGTPITSSENIYAVNYNVLRIMSGMGGLAYSN